MESYIRVKGKIYSHRDFKCKVDSLHIYGKQDPFYEQCKIEPELFAPGHSNIAPVEVEHDEGHKVPRSYKDEKNQQIVDKFIGM